METVQLSDRHVDLTRGRVHHAGEEIRLTTQEVALLRILVERGTVPATDLFRIVWGPRTPFDNRKLSNAVGRLRKKIEADPADPRHVLTDFGSGYRFVPGASAVDERGAPSRPRARVTSSI